jgi:UDP-N-acetylglucosamine diphosphorylase / glucose-1-phosphate thymidylyltransferase / UDP-N-acetylgalactosamine diphosphorylase / glucosamine-1-phosphate N-acetyltransferase / galactosamine-1-phosphate N-acetyltransferase
VSLPAVVMAAGLGTRLRPLTEVVAKPALPIDGRPVVASVLRALVDSGCEAVALVTGHLAEQVERLAGDGSAFGLEVRCVRQPSPDGSADAVRRAGLEPPYLVLAADTVFGDGDVARFAAAFEAGGTAGAIAIRHDPEKDPILLENGRVVRVHDPGGAGPWSGAPLWGVGRAVHDRLCLDARPYELGNAFQQAIDSGESVMAVEIGSTRDLTRPVDLLEENFPYVRAIR